MPRPRFCGNCNIAGTLVYPQIPPLHTKLVVLHQILPGFCQKQGRRCITGKLRQNVENPQKNFVKMPKNTCNLRDAVL